MSPNGWGEEYYEPKLSPWMMAQQRTSAQALIAKIRGEPPPPSPKPPPEPPEDEELLYEEYRRTGGTLDRQPWRRAGSPLRPEYQQPDWTPELRPFEQVVGEWGEKTRGAWSQELESEMMRSAALVLSADELLNFKNYIRTGGAPNLREWQQAGKPLRAEPAWGLPITGVTPEVTPEVDLSQYEEVYADKPMLGWPDEVDFSEGNEEAIEQWMNAEDAKGFTGIEKLNAGAYGSIYLDEAGKVVSEVDIMQMNPDAEVTKVWFLGGTFRVEQPFAVRDASDISEYTPTPLTMSPEKIESLRAQGVSEVKIRDMVEKSREVQTLLMKGEQERRVREEAPIKAEENRILASEMSYDEKVDALTTLYQTTPREISGMGAVGDEYIQAVNKVQATLSPEEIEELRARPKEIPGFVEPTAPEAKVDVAELTSAISPYGITVSDTYPYLSPITEAHLRRLPQPTLEMMALYLAEKGLNWRDWMALSGGFYGGAAPRMPAWDVAGRWG